MDLLSRSAFHLYGAIAAPLQNLYPPDNRPHYAWLHTQQITWRITLKRSSSSGSICYYWLIGIYPNSFGVGKVKCGRTFAPIRGQLEWLTNQDYQRWNNPPNLRHNTSRFAYMARSQLSSAHSRDLIIQYGTGGRASFLSSRLHRAGSRRSHLLRLKATLPNWPGGTKDLFFTKSVPWFVLLKG